MYRKLPNGKMRSNKVLFPLPKPKNSCWSPQSTYVDEAKRCLRFLKVNKICLCHTRWDQNFVQLISIEDVTKASSCAVDRICLNSQSNICVALACSLSVCVGFPWVLLFPPTFQNTSSQPFSKPLILFRFTRVLEPIPDDFGREAANWRAHTGSSNGGKQPFTPTIAPKDHLESSVNLISNLTKGFSSVEPKAKRKKENGLDLEKKKDCSATHLSRILMQFGINIYTPTWHDGACFSHSNSTKGLRCCLGPPQMLPSSQKKKHQKNHLTPT